MVRNIFAVIVGIVAGALVNTGIVMFGPMVIPPPPGADMTTAEGIAAAMPLMEARHFVVPFAAHALGSFVGAFAAASLAVSHKMNIALGIGAFTMLGGILAAWFIPAPFWFVAVDLIFAYIPTAWIAGKLATSGKMS
ncbi:MAG: hypothetical protein IPM21_00480 [Acidobacteria bacterium]|nr:hypothetical protein [Acidobacteriota bacterium]